jgi:hypothetical protein
MNPAACAGCHPDHVREWSGSMHAYASEDPVFLAMNRRMQRETNGAAGDFCVKCHAPMAVRTGATKDGLNLPALPRPLQGVTCYFCHSIDAVEGTHNAQVHLAADDVLRGGLTNPVKNSAHRAAYGPLHDREKHESASTCGACHDIVAPKGAHIERTFAEWQSSLYAKREPGKQLTCGKCHMEGREGLAADAPGVGLRTVHSHAMPGVDVAMTPFPETDTQRRLVQENLDNALLTKLCVRRGRRGIEIEVTLDNAFVGHGWPSGANQDRRAWAEVIAYRDGQPILSSGAIADDAPVPDSPDLFLLRDNVYDEFGKETHDFWEAARYVSRQLSPAVTNVPSDPAFFHATVRVYSLADVNPPDRVTLRVRIRPIDYDVLDDLIATGDLDPPLRAKVTTITLAGASREWTSDMGLRCVP